MSAPLVAIVGRPNVGKSTLFNRLVGFRQAIVEDRPGVTRDRLYGAGEWDSRHFLVVDTGGLDPSLDTGLPGHVHEQVRVAIDEADLILFVVDAVDGATSVDREIADQLRRSGKAVLLVANKADSPGREQKAWALAELGLGDLIPVSAAHGRGMPELCDAILDRVCAVDEAVEVVPPGVRLAFIGRPNAGKSTVVNALLRAPRVIVDEVAGTTHDPIYLPFRWQNRDLVLIDTAGLRRRKQVAKAMEKLAAIKSIRAMERTQVMILVVDAEAGVTDQDQRIARMAFSRGKGVVVLLHKWDCIADDKKRAHDTMARTEQALAFLEKPRIVRTSVTGRGRDAGQGRARNLERMLEACVATARSLERRITTAELNDELAAAVVTYAPPSFKNRRVKLLFATQVESSPPLIVVSANHGRCLAPAYERYLVRRFRKRWGLWGVPIRIVVRARGKTNRDRAGQ